MRWVGLLVVGMFEGPNFVQLFRIFDHCASINELNSLRNTLNCSFK